MARLGATHRTTAPSCTPATRDRAGRLHREVHGRPAASRNPGLLDDSRLASASPSRIARGPQAPGRQPGHPGARSSSPAASGRPGRAPVHPLRRDPRSAPPPGGRSPCGRHDGRGRQRTTAIQEDPVGGRRVVRREALRCIPGIAGKDWRRRLQGLLSSKPGDALRVPSGTWRQPILRALSIQQSDQATPCSAKDADLHQFPISGSGRSQCGQQRINIQARPGTPPRHPGSPDCRQYEATQ
jgi:hypothetical protein